jgi:predicted enzyme related to lactoylglutathione lyase
MNSIGYFEIQSSQPSAAARFYGGVFGWTFERDSTLPIEYWRASTAGMNGAILERPTPAPPVQSGTNAFVCSIQVASFDETADAIIRQGGQVALPKFAVPGKCWQGYFIDLDGNTFGLFEVDSSAR